jgi:hypothetical protein
VDFPAAGQSQQYFITNGRRPIPDWRPGEVIRETRTVYLGPEMRPPIEARLSLIPWGVGPPLGEIVTLRLDP